MKRFSNIRCQIYAPFEPQENNLSSLDSVNSEKEELLLIF
jgi:hypothetical protein